MKKPYIICVEDQREVLSTLIKDLETFSKGFNIEGCECAREARELLDTLDASGETVLLIICDHIMPSELGVDLLIALTQDAKYQHLSKILLTGQATHIDTIKAINEANIGNYIAKPWTKTFLINTVKTQLTLALLATGEDHTPWLTWLDQAILYNHLRV